MNRPLLPLASAVLSLFAATLSSAARADTSDNLVLQWNDVALQAIRDTRPAPTVVSRSLAVVQTCEYDAWTAYDGRAAGTQLGTTLRRPAKERTADNKDRAISYAAYRALVDLFPSRKADFDAKMAALGYDPADTSTDTTTPTGIGNVACQAVLTYRHGDGSNQLGDLHPGAYTDYTGYAPVNTPDVINDPDHWQPLRVSNGQGGFNVQVFATPQWKNVATFALQSVDQYAVKPPALYGSKAYVDQANQLIAYSANLTDTQKAIAEYWADGPSSELPPGHWNLLAHWVSLRDAHTLDQDVKLYFALDNALMDAGIWAWGQKREHDSVRPISAVHYLFPDTSVYAWAGPGLGSQWIAGGTWMPYQPPTVVTPPFAEFVSGHSTFSAAAAAILRRSTGSDVFGDSVTIAAGSSKVEPGLSPTQPVVLSWATFTDAANEAGMSRRYGGIHFPTADLEGRRIGKQIGDAAFQRAQRYIRGSD